MTVREILSGPSDEELLEDLLDLTAEE